ncbi:hypothetical protein MASR2M48_04490 [Spirochaetota bacterium]
MQVVRLSRARGPRSWGNKLIELWMALRLELTHTKDQVLSRYAELAPFGGNVVGIEAAGFRWFGRRSGQLTWAEAATLAVLPNSPGLLHPGRSRDELALKRDGLLLRLKNSGMIEEEEYFVALKEPLPESPLPMHPLPPSASQG